MGLFDSLKSAAEGSIGGDAQQAFSSALENSPLGGVSGLLGKLQAGGLGEAVSSWMPGGDHQLVGADQIRDALGDEHVQALAAKFGVSPDDVLSHLSEHLPGLAAAHQGADSSGAVG